MSKDEEPLQELLDEFGEFFSFRAKREIELQFLKFRILQSEHGILINQTNHIVQSIMNDSFDKDEKVKYESSPFPLDSKFEYELYVALLMSEDELEKVEKNKTENMTNGLENYTTWQFEVDKTLAMQ